MDDYMLMEYLRNQGIGHNMSDEEFTWKFQEFLKENSSRNRRGRMRNMNDWQDYNEDYNDMKGYGGYMNNMGSSTGNSYNMRNHMYGYDMPKRPFNVTFNRYQGYPYSNHKSGMDHFTEMEARNIVNSMYHNYNGKRVSGEIFTMEKAREVLNQHRSDMHSDATAEDVYVAINAQYHDYCPLFKQWFGSNTDNKIIESAILFWFKDDDYHKGSKLMNYFE